MKKTNRSDRAKAENGTFLEWLGIERAPNWRVAGALGKIVSVSLFLLVFSAFAAAFSILFSVFRASDESPSLGSGALVAGILGSPFIIWATYIKQRELGFKKEGHITDRISKAVEQLGAEKVIKTHLKDDDGNLKYNGNLPSPVEMTVPNIEVRIGGILSLERVAQDSVAYDNGRDHVRIMEVICCYLRENSAAGYDRTIIAKSKAYPARIDLQKAVDVLRRRTMQQLAIEAKERYSLDLRNVDFSGFDLSGCSFIGATIPESIFEFTDLSGCDFTGASMTGSVFKDCTWSGARIHGTNMNMCLFFREELGLLFGASLDSVFVEGANFSHSGLNLNQVSRMFGSSDTLLPDGYKEIFNKRLQLGDFPEEVDLADIEDEILRFIHWSPFISRHPATTPYRKAFREKYNLNGRPFTVSQ